MIYSTANPQVVAQIPSGSRRLLDLGCGSGGLLLRRLHQSLNPGGILIVALPNVLFWQQRFRFLQDQFRNTDGGLMDRTHFRFYDWQSAHQLLEESGYAILHAVNSGFFPLPIVRKLLPAALVESIDTSAARSVPGCQFVFACRSRQP